MDILVDYDNILQHERQRGVVYVIDKVVSTIGLVNLGGSSRLHFRLYGGWYEQQVPTRSAQQIASDILASFPMVQVLRESGTTAKVLVNAELAYSIRFDPSCHLWHTFRPKGMPRGLECRNPASVGCTSPTCPLLPMYSFFTTRSCPDPSCDLTPEDLIYRKEQKLVDTMLAADIFYNAHTKAARIAVVSSDDDVWPAIKTAVQLGSHVLHVHTKRGHSTPRCYAHGVAGRYVQLNL